ALAIKVCIRTGARYGCEFAKLTAKEVKDVADSRMEWFWPEGTKVKGKPRTIRVTDREIIEDVRSRMDRYPTGPLFRNSQGKPWTQKTLKNSFKRLKKRMKAKGYEFDECDCLYTTRHTFAKRMLNGYWSDDRP